jgi:hypothetical protein
MNKSVKGDVCTTDLPAAMHACKVIDVNKSTVIIIIIIIR